MDREWVQWINRNSGARKRRIFSPDIYIYIYTQQDDTKRITKPTRIYYLQTILTQDDTVLMVDSERKLERTFREGDKGK